MLKKHLAELREHFPLLLSLTADAIYATRPLAQAMTNENCEYLVQIKDNHGDIREAAEHCLGDVHERKPAAQTTKKRALVLIGGDCGWISIMPSMCGSS